jgi:predicted kinase
MKKVIVMSGVSGSGKSTYAQKLFAAAENGACIVSADNFFLNEQGEYKFDPSKLSEAHAQCFRAFLAAMTDSIFPYNLIIVDNTNTQTFELAPYVLGAAAFGYDCGIITITVSVEHGADTATCAERNKHDVPFAVIQRQARNMAERKLPPYWEETLVSFQR